MDSRALPTEESRTRSALSECTTQLSELFRWQLRVLQSSFDWHHLQEPEGSAEKTDRQRKKPIMQEKIIQIPKLFEHLPVQKKVQRTVEVPPIQYVEKVVDVTVVKQVQGSQIQKVQMTVEVPQIQKVQKSVDVPVVKQAQVPMVQQVQKTVEVAVEKRVPRRTPSRSRTFPNSSRWPNRSLPMEMPSGQPVFSTRFCRWLPTMRQPMRASFVRWSRQDMWNRLRRRYRRPRPILRSLPIRRSSRPGARWNWRATELTKVKLQP